MTAPQALTINGTLNILKFSPCFNNIFLVKKEFWTNCGLLYMKPSITISKFV